MKKSIGLLFSFLIMIFLCGCARQTVKSKKLLCLSLGMTKEQVIGVMGKPAIFHGSIINKLGQKIEVFEYIVDRTGFWDLIETLEKYWLYFCENKLVQWGEPCDWEKASDTISEIRFR